MNENKTNTEKTLFKKNKLIQRGQTLTKNKII